MSLNLTATNHSIELITTTTGAVHVSVSFIDTLAGVKTPGSQTTVITTATTTAVVSAPAASTTREINHINIEAVGANTVTVHKDVAATDHTLIGPVVLAAGERLEFTSASGWKVDVDVEELFAMSAGSFLANITAGSAIPTDHPLATFAGAGLTYTNVTGIMAVGAGTYITVNADDVAVNRTALSADLDSTSVIDSSGTLQRAALTGAISAAQNANTTVFAGILNNASATTDRTNLNFVGFTITDDAVNDRIVITSPLGVTDGDKGDITVSSTGTVWTIDANAVTLAKMATMATGTFLANITAGSAVPTAHSLSTFAGGGLSYTNVTGIMAVGAGTGITVNANDVQLSTITAESFFMNATAGAAVPTAVAGSTVAGAGLTYTTGGILAVGSSTSITVNANDIQRPALTGAIAAAANANTTVFSGILNNAVATTDRTNLNFVGFTITDDAGNDRIVITAPAAGTAGHTIRHNGTGLTQRAGLNFLNTGTITMAGADDAGGNESEITAAVNLTANYAWTGNHSVVSSGAFTVSSGLQITMQGVSDMSFESSTGGVHIGAGHTLVSPNVSNLDVVINGAGGVMVNAHSATTETGATVGQVQIKAESAVVLFTNAVERLAIENDGAWQVNNTIGNIGQVLMCEGTSASPEWRNPKDRRTCLWWEDFEFIEQVIASATDGSVVNFGNTTWFQAGTSETSTYDLIGAESGHPGILRITTGSTVNTKTGIYRGSLTAASGWVRGDQIQQFEAIVRFTSGSTTTRAFFIGFNEDPQQLDTAGTSNSNIVGFLFDSSSAALDTNVQCVTREADGVAVVTDSGVSYSAGIHGLWKSFKIVQDTLGTIEFFINDSLVATHASQVPDSETMNCGLTIMNRTTGNDVMDIDYVEFVSRPLTRF
jgi:pyridoxine 5'-phosphate synthase PdxJ